MEPMTTPHLPLHPPQWRISQEGADSVVVLSGDWLASQTGLRSAVEITRLLGDGAVKGSLRYDVSGLGRWDSALVAFARMMRAAAGEGANKRFTLDESTLPEAALRLLKLAETNEPLPSASGDKAAASVVARVGHGTLGFGAELGAIATLVGESVFGVARGLGGRAFTRSVDILHLMREAGANALVIVAIVNGLIGAILAFVGAVQLQRFGAGIFVADLVGIAMVREMAAVMTAIVMAGRTGGAYAAHLATMQGNEEIDALKVLGIPAYDFLVLPRVVALVTMMPLLYLYGCAIGLLGGFVVSLAILDMSATTFLDQIQGAIAGRQFAIGLVKSVAFGFLVALAGCHIGLRAGRSAADVGRAATSAVVVGIVGVIALDAVFAVCADRLGI
ncbi:Protein of unknown function DUF140 [Rhodospirillum rubrum ATCC 11170]|uniref:STAS domain-containing protein n=3 Tax=Rhodospirillum rubrum TaxID=1085 RepID=Q2RRK0_RHORT|nr:ABC transporter permease [Rhodospirillum rubrum]ABC23245.1 Protein of unknown function DUF140 [Rhodospirillum rubrum ATCC 11170]MBK5954885.1 hypothetical protein [Rhodospirillum rubrum]